MGCKTMKRVELLAELDSLTEEQIEAGLAEGIWEEPTRPLVQHYLYQVRQQRMERKVAEQIEVAREVSRSAVDRASAAEDEARDASFRATAAIIIAGGAMFAAMGSAAYCVSRTTQIDSRAHVSSPIQGPSSQSLLSLLLSPRHL